MKNMMSPKLVRPCIVLCVFLFIVLLLGCSPGAKSVTAGYSQFIYVELWTNNGCPRVGETVTLRATVTNQSSEPFHAELVDQPVLDLFVGGTRWSERKPLSPDLTQLDLKPGESKSIEMQYVVKAGGTAAYAQFIPTTQYIKQPIEPYMALDYCPNFIGP